jgi:hypothetical protein
MPWWEREGHLFDPQDQFWKVVNLSKVFDEIAQKINVISSGCHGDTILSFKNLSTITKRHSKPLPDKIRRIP